MNRTTDEESHQLERQLEQPVTEEINFLLHALEMAGIKAAIVALPSRQITQTSFPANDKTTTAQFFFTQNAVHPDDLPTVTAFYDSLAIISEKEEQVIVCRIKDLAKTWMDVSVQGRKWEYDGEGNITAVLITAQEAAGDTSGISPASAREKQTETKQLRTKIRQQFEGKYRTLFNSMDEGYCIIKMLYDDAHKPCDWRYIEVNAAFERHNGLVNAAGKTIRSLSPDIEQKWMDIYGRVAETGESIRFEEDSIALQRVFDLYAFRIGEPRERLVAVLFTNITERRAAEKILLESEARKNYLLKLSDALRPVADLTQMQTNAVTLLAKQFGVMRASYFEMDADQNRISKMVGYETGTIHLPDRMQLSDFGAMIQETFRAGQTMVVDDIETVPEQASMRPAYQAISVRAWAGVPLVKNGQLLAVLSIHEPYPRSWTREEIDILEETAERTWAAVEQARAEQALRENEQQLREMVKLRDEFVSVASHELKTPLTSVKAYAQLVLEQLEKSGDKANLDFLLRLNVQIDRLTGLINNLLDATRVSEGQFQLRLEQIDIAAVLHNCIEEIKSAASQRIMLNIARVPTIIADQERIGQVIINLMSNAMKYAPAKSSIYVNCRLQQDWIEISIRDEGCGIPKKDIGRIFEKFFRVTANKMDTYPGLGLGLHICAQIIQMHGGKISVQSELGKGAVFSVWLPV